MTEQEWNNAQNPQQLAHHITCNNNGTHRATRLISNRRETLICTALIRQHTQDHNHTLQQIEHNTDHNQPHPKTLLTITNQGTQTTINTTTRLFKITPILRALNNPENHPHQITIIHDIAGTPHNPTRITTITKCTTCHGKGKRRTRKQRTINCYNCQGTGQQEQQPTWLQTIQPYTNIAYNEQQPNGTLNNTTLKILADIAEENGCTNQKLLNHLRNNQPHYKGCHAIDLLKTKP
jgi:hypothetical protein